MKKLFLFFAAWLLSVAVFAQLYYTKPSTTSGSSATVYDGGWSPPAEWRDSLGTIDITDGGALAANTIKILVDTRSGTRNISFSVGCFYGYKVKWGKGESWANYANNATASRTYDTLKCQQYCVIEIQVQSTGNLSGWTIQSVSSLHSQPQSQHILWFAGNMPSTGPVFYSSTAGAPVIQAIYLKSVTTLPQNGNRNCYSLRSVTLPTTGVTSVGIDYFTNCYSLTSVTLPTSLPAIPNNFFNGCQSLQTVIIPNTSTSIGTYAFSGCYALKSVTIGTGVTSIGTAAFQNCTSLGRLDIPNNVTSLASSMFIQVNSMREIAYQGTTAAQDHNNILFRAPFIDTLNWKNLKTTKFSFYGESGKLNNLGGNGNLAGDSIPLRLNWASSTFSSTSAPQLNLSYNKLDTTQIQKLFRCLPTVGAAGSNAKTVTVVGCSGAATLSAYAVAIATAKGWQVLK